MFNWAIWEKLAVGHVSGVPCVDTTRHTPAHRSVECWHMANMERHAFVLWVVSAD